MAKGKYSHKYDNSARQDKVENKEVKDKIAFVVSLVFVLSLGFFGYRYFNGTVNTLGIFTKQTNETDISSASTIRNEDDTKNMQNENKNSAQTTKTTADKVTANWKANDYAKGDIQPGNYKVQSGDTLWEIAEAVYGNGAQWTQILAANSGDIGYLPSGQNALIFAGQTLVIPAIN